MVLEATHPSSNPRRVKNREDPMPHLVCGCICAGQKSPMPCLIWVCALSPGGILQGVGGGVRVSLYTIFTSVLRALRPNFSNPTYSSKIPFSTHVLNSKLKHHLYLLLEFCIWHLVKTQSTPFFKVPNIWDMHELASSHSTLRSFRLHSSLLSKFYSYE